MNLILFIDETFWLMSYANAGKFRLSKRIEDAQKFNFQNPELFYQICLVITGKYESVRVVKI